MRLQPTETSTLGPAEDHTWLGSETGTNDCETIQLDKALLTAVYADGFVKSGTVLGKVTATGRYGPYDNAASDGRQTATHVLFTSQNVARDNDTVAPGMWHGSIIQSKLPKQSGAGSLDAAGITDLKHFQVR